MTFHSVSSAVGGWKTGAGVVGGFITAFLLFVGWVRSPQLEVDAHQDERIEAIEEAVDTIRSDLREQGSMLREQGEAGELMKCWIRHQIHDTDASECLVDNGDT